MCLTVKKEVKYLVNKCKKSVKVYNNKIVTPFRDAEIPYHGLMIPHFRNSNKININDFIYGGFIHAYRNSEKSSSVEITTKPIRHILLEAYAFWVVAYGKNNDLICKALYIPKLDLTNRRDSRVSMLENRYTKDKIIKEFDLQSILGDY